MKKIFIHIGTHKTGTTSIQAFLRKNEKIFRESDFYIPKSGTISNLSGHHNVAWELLSSDRFSKKFGGIDQLIEEIKYIKENNVIISSEDFEFLGRFPENISEFDKKLRFHFWDPHYIVFFRRQDQYAISLYHELKNNGMKDRFFEYFLVVIKNKSFLFKKDWFFEFDYFRFVNKWESSTRSSLTINKCSEKSKNIIEFVENLGINSGKFDRESLDLILNKKHGGFSKKNSKLLPIFKIIILIRFCISNIKFNIMIRNKKS